MNSFENLTQITDELKEQYIQKARKKIERRVSGFSVRDVAISEAAYYDARTQWERDGYVDNTVSTLRGISQRENDLFDKVIGDFIKEVEEENKNV